MRQNLLKEVILLLFLGAFQNSYSQCNLDSINWHSINSHMNLERGCVEAPFDKQLTLGFKSDTAIFINGNYVNVPVDSVKIESVQNVPDGMNLDFSNGNEAILPNNNNTPSTCLNFHGTPENEEYNEIQILSRSYYTHPDLGIQYYSELNYLHFSSKEYEADFNYYKNEDKTHFSATVNIYSTFSWDFGDGNSSTERYPVHEYEEDGTYNICVTATSHCQADTVCEQITIGCETPVANFTKQFNEYNPFSVFVNGHSSTNHDNYSWEFSDGKVSNEIQLWNNFYNAGDYEVCLTVSNDCGLSDKKCDSVSFDCIQPIANFSDSVPGFEAHFYDISNHYYGDRNTATTHWDFGDGNTSTETNPIHTYANYGTYTVCMITTNSCGSDTTCKKVTVPSLTSSDYITVDNYSIFPNPVTNHVSIQFDNSTSGLMEIMTLEGQVVKSEWFDETNLLSYPVDLTSGIYILQITNGVQKHQQKLIVR